MKIKEACVGGGQVLIYCKTDQKQSLAIGTDNSSFYDNKNENKGDGGGRGIWGGGGWG